MLIEENSQGVSVKALKEVGLFFLYPPRLFACKVEKRVSRGGVLSRVFSYSAVFLFQLFSGEIAADRSSVVVK